MVFFPRFNCAVVYTTFCLWGDSLSLNQMTEWLDNVCSALDVAKGEAAAAVNLSVKPILDSFVASGA